MSNIALRWAFCHEWEGFFSEVSQENHRCNNTNDCGLKMMLYADPSYLRSLQGKVVPEIIGLYLVDGAISVAMELPSSTFWVEASEDMSDYLKRKCITAFDEIHARGVLHNDVELRHMLVSSTGEVTIIDFQMSRALKPKHEVGLQRATEDDIRLEKRKVRFKLDYNYAQRRENVKRTRVMTRRLRNLERKRRRKLLPPGSEISPEDEYEDDDKDDIINPIVGDAEWMDLWLGDEFESSCYVVPGQDASKVEATLKEFALQEIGRQEEEEEQKEAQILAYQAKMRPITAAAGHSPADAPSSLSLVSSSQKLEPPPKAPVPEGRDMTPDAVDTLPSHVPVHQPMCVSSEPPRGIKRPRDSAEDKAPGHDDALNEDDSGLQPASKRRHVDADATNVERDSLTTSARQEGINESSTSVASLNEGQESLSSQYTTPPSSFPSTPSIYPFLNECNSIAVPYNDFTGPKPGKLRNVFPTKELSDWRRSWIRQDNIRQFREEGAVHPYDEVFQDLLKQMDTDSDGADDEAVKPREGKKKRKWKGTVQRGSIKRYKRELEAPGKTQWYAFMRKEQYFKDRAVEMGWSVDDDFSDSGDEEDRRMARLFGPEEKREDESIREGPKILTYAELEARNTEFAGGQLDSRAAAPAFSLGSGSTGSFAGPSRSSSSSTTPRHSILRRGLTAEEMLKQRAYEETLLILGEHPNQHNVIDEDDVSTGPRTSVPLPRPTLVRRTSTKHLTPLLKPYTEASEVPAPSKSKPAQVTRRQTGYISTSPPSHMFIPRAAASAASALGLTGRRSISSLPLRKKRPIRTAPAVSICYFTGESAPFPPLETVFPVQSEWQPGSTRAFTIPYSSSPPPMGSGFPTPSIPTGAPKRPTSMLAQARPATRASGSNVTLDDLYDGSLTENISNTPELNPVQGPSFVPPHRQAPHSNPGCSTNRERDLIGAELAPGPGSHATEDTEMEDETDSDDNTGLEAEGDEQVDVNDNSDAGNTSLSTHLQAFAKAMFPWLDRR